MGSMMEADNTPLSIVPLAYAVLCVACSCIVDSRECHGDRCSACASSSGLLSLARVLNPQPELGEITYIHVSRGASSPRSDWRESHDL